MGKGEKKIWKWIVEVHKMEWLYPYVRLEDFMKVCKWLEEENKKLKKYYDRDKEELMESCYSLAKENKKLNIKVSSLEWEIKWLNYTIEKLKEENQTLESDGYKM